MLRTNSKKVIEKVRIYIIIMFPLLICLAHGLKKPKAKKQNTVNVKPRK